MRFVGRKISFGMVCSAVGRRRSKSREGDMGEGEDVGV